MRYFVSYQWLSEASYRRLRNRLARGDRIDHPKQVGYRMQSVRNLMNVCENGRRMIRLAAIYSDQI